MIEKLIEEVRTLKNCIVLPPTHRPFLSKNEHKLPTDIEKFYEICGGIELYNTSDYSITIVPPDEFSLANPIIVGEMCEGDITADWFIIGIGSTSEYITIDLSSKRLGRCYDSYSDRHGVVGENSIIAYSFTELLKRLIANKGDYWYWLEDDFDSLGDAYDTI